MKIKLSRFGVYLTSEMQHGKYGDVIRKSYGIGGQPHLGNDGCMYIQKKVSYKSVGFGLFCSLLAMIYNLCERIQCFISGVKPVNGYFLDRNDFVFDKNPERPTQNNGGLGELDELQKSLIKSISKNIQSLPRVQTAIGIFPFQIWKKEELFANITHECVNEFVKTYDQPFCDRNKTWDEINPDYADYCKSNNLSPYWIDMLAGFVDSNK